MSNLSKPIDQCWTVYFRDGGDSAGRWYAWETTSRGTREQAIDAALIRNCAGMSDRKDWRRLRRAGLVKCARTTLYADLPSPPEVA